MRINVLTIAILRALHHTPETMGLRVFQAHVRQGDSSPWLAA